MENVISRLERIADRFEKIEGRAVSGSSTAITSATTGNAPLTATTSSQGGYLAKYDSFLSQCLSPVVKNSRNINPEAKQATTHLEKAFLAARGILEISGQCKRPDTASWQQLLQPVANEIMAVSKLAENRRSTAYNHLKALEECVQSLSWLAYTGPECGMNVPPQHVGDAWGGAEFYSNKILMEFKSANASGSEPNIAWVKALKEMMLTLQAYVRENFPSGLKWTSAGGSIKDAKVSGPPTSTTAPATGAAPPAPGSKAAAPPPPPPPPPGPPPKPLTIEEMAEGSNVDSGNAAAPAGGMPALFAELQKGEEITSGLRKVTPEMKAKNQAGKSGMVTVQAKDPASSGAARAGGLPSRPPRLEFDAERKRWIVENQVGEKGLRLEALQPTHTVYIFNCKESVVQVPAKANAISIDNCTKTGVVFADVISSCEAINSRSIQVQCTGSVPTVSIEKTDGVQLYLPEQLTRVPDAVSVVTAKCSEVNVVVVPTSPDADPLEQPVPEQFISFFQSGKLVTTPVQHSAN